MSRRNITIIVVAVLALAAGLVAYGILTQPKKVVAMRQVVTALDPLPKHAHIGPQMLGTEQRQADQVPVDAASNPGEVIGDIVTQPIAAGDVVEFSSLAKAPILPPNELQVKVGMRAVTIPVDAVKSVGGLVNPGDRVDVLAIVARTGVAPPAPYAILRDVEVLAGNHVTGPPISIAPVAVSPPPAGQAPASPAPTPTPAPPLPAVTVTLEGTPAQADILATADINTVLRLALRSPGEPARSQPVQPLVFPAVAQAKPEGASGPVSSHPGVTVINGDTVEP